MKYGFVNNLSTELAVAVSAGDTQIELSTGADLIAAALQNVDAVALTLIATDDQGNETEREVVYATAAAPPMATVMRAQEGTAAVSFAPGDGCEGRLTAGALQSYSNIEVGDGLDIGVGNLLNESAESYVLIGNNNDIADAADFGWASLVVGNQQYSAGASGDTFVLLGASNSLSDAAEKPAFMAGIYNYIETDNGDPSTLGTFDGGLVVIGQDCYAGNSCSGLIVGFDNYVRDDSRSACCVGTDNYQYFVNEGVYLGNNNQSYGSAGALVEKPVSIGNSNLSDYSFTVCVGNNNSCHAEASGAIGNDLKVNVERGIATSMISFLPLETLSTSSAVTAANNTSSQVTLGTANIDLTSADSTATITLPANAILLPDAFDVVVTEADGAGGTPEIQIGPDDVTPASYLAATPVTKTAVGGRETHAPLVMDGITALRVAVTTAGTGTAYKVKVVVRGYVIEV